MFERHGLRHEVECPEPQAHLGFVLGRNAGDDDNRHAGILDGTQLQEIEPTHAGEPEVEEDQVRAWCSEPLQGRFGRRDEFGLVAQAADEDLEELANGPVILDDQHPHAVVPPVEP